MANESIPRTKTRGDDRRTMLALGTPELLPTLVYDDQEREQGVSFAWDGCWVSFPWLFQNPIY